MKRLALALAVLAAPAHAQVACNTHDALIAFGASQLGQYEQVRMIDSSGALVIIIANQETGDWSLIITDGDNACVYVVGNGFEAGPGV